MKLHLVAATLLIAIGTAGSALAADATGNWLTEGGKSRIKIADCGGALCGSIVWLKEPNDEGGKPKTDKNNPDAGMKTKPLIGVQIVRGMKPNGANKWAGQVYNAEDGKTYSGNITLTSDNALQLQGCALGGLLCKSQTWTRAN
jgi:uncharacterized protein (DUF2147 family)